MTCFLGDMDAMKEVAVHMTSALVQLRSGVNLSIAAPKRSPA
jgi:hypothetical protein